MWCQDAFKQFSSCRINFNMLSLIVVLLVTIVPGTPSDLPCNPKRTEIGFPIVHDVTGSVTSFMNTFNGSPDILYVTLKWRRRRLEVVLYKNQVTMPQTFTEWSEGNETVARFTEKTCFYQGYVKGQSSSYVALSTCEGLSGYIQTDEELLFLQPATSDPGQGRQAHMVYTCEPRTRQPEPEWGSTSTARHMGRRRRSTQRPKYLEVMVAVDSSVVDQIGSQARTEDYVMTLMNIANTVYQHHTLGQDIRVVVTKIIFLKRSQQDEVLKRMDAFATVNLFCHWSQSQIPYGQPMNYDISVLITKEELGPSGYAPITGLCNPVRSCAAVRDEGFTTGFIIAHEMAHVFGLFHDGHGNNCHGRKYETSMMAALVESKLNHFWWSDCSNRRMKEMIRYAACLNNKPEPIKDHYPLEAGSKLDHKLGRPWSLDFQCRMEFGSHFKLCAAFYNDPCGVLWCSHGSQPMMCRTKRGPPMPGSSCGRDRECRDQRCQYVGNMSPVDGHWGAWSPWTECNSECGVGVRQRARVCDSPVPNYGGKECEGESDMWDTCVNEDCEKFDDIRAGECNVWDSLQIRYGTHKWQPFEGQNASTVCHQTCKSTYTKEILTIDVHVADGAPCSYTGNNSNICMEGKCLEVGCDGVINSTKRQDMCGICGGDGSECKRVRGRFTKKPTSADQYIAAVTIPAGARDIKIEETTQSVQFLALQDPKYGTLVFNGDKEQSGNDKFVVNGAMFTYTRTGHNNNESIISPGPLMRELKLMIFPNKEMRNTAVHYSYIVHKSDFTMEKNKFKWKFIKWSDCSVTCGQGVQTIIHGCFDKDTNEQVNDEYCEFLDPPRKDEVRCHRESCGFVSYNFAMSNDYEECDAKCGEEGIQVQKFHCERMFLKNNTFEEVPMSLCDKLAKPRQTRVCKGEPCEEEGRYQWSVSDDWTVCPCGQKGTQTRDVHCEKVVIKDNGERDNLGVADDAKCGIPADKPSDTRSCTGEPCEPKYQWSVSDDWTVCPCGQKGTQTRDVHCEKVAIKDNGERDNLGVADDAKCGSPADKPSDTRSCTGEPCEPEFQWVESGLYKGCDADCGEVGTQKAILECQQTTVTNGVHFFELADEYFCENLIKPSPVTKPCTGEPCDNDEPQRYTWQPTNEWTDCPAECGQKGTQTRIYYCEEESDDGVLYEAEDEKCGFTTKPVEIRDCEKEGCPLKWTIERWSECSVTCGRGKHYRKVYCGDPDTDVDDIHCKDSPPATSKVCKRKECPVPRDENCNDLYSFCSTYKALQFRCKRANFKRKCCRTCADSESSAMRPKNALERYMKRRGLGRWYSR